MKRMLKHIANKNRDTKVNNRYETCVCCGTPTDVLITEEVKDRAYYISGVGQLCQRCFLELQTEMTEEMLRRQELEMRILLKMCTEEEI